MIKGWLMWWNKYMQNLSNPLTVNFLPPHVAKASLVLLKWQSVAFSHCWCLSTKFYILLNKIESLISIHFDQSYYYYPHYAAIYSFCAGGLLFIQISEISNIERYERSWQSKNFWYFKDESHSRIGTSRVFMHSMRYNICDICNDCIHWCCWTHWNSRTVVSWCYSYCYHCYFHDNLWCSTNVRIEFILRLKTLNKVYSNKCWIHKSVW